LSNEIKKLGGDAAFVRRDSRKMLMSKRWVDFTVCQVWPSRRCFNNAWRCIGKAPWLRPTEAELPPRLRHNVWAGWGSELHASRNPFYAQDRRRRRSSIHRRAGNVVHGSGQVILIASKPAVAGYDQGSRVWSSPTKDAVLPVAPAGVAKPTMVESLWPEQKARARLLRSLHPVGRIGTTEEIAQRFAISVSDNAKFTPSQPARPLVVDGAFLAQ